MGQGPARRLVTEARDAVERLTGKRATSSSALGGSVYEVHLADGGRLVAKRYAAAGEVNAEASSLRWLADAHAVPVPEVIACDGNWLLTAFVPSGRSSDEAAEELGRRLSQLHRAGAPAFGSPPDGGPRVATIGMAQMTNVECPTWHELFARYRIEPYLRLACDRRSLRDADVAAIEKVIGSIEELAGPPEPPARLHGDLWSGNVHWGGDGRAWLIDPAAHGGHRETDLAMLRLFGCPHLDRIMGSYMESTPLAAGWRQRIPLHQLFPLLVHAVLFGGSYGAQAGAAARAALTA